jgi:outer membrane lipopolysaccharide assembly protein LptE/RlpB
MVMQKGWRLGIAILCTSVLIGCGFRAQGEVPLAPPLKKMYLQTDDPYGTLSRDLQQNMKLSHVDLVDSPADASTILAITHDDATQTLLSVSGTQQTRQYNLVVTVTFNVSDNKGNTLIGDQTLQESRAITVQSNQILGSSNEASLYYQQMRHILATAIMNRLSSTDVTTTINDAFVVKQPLPVKKKKKKA